MRVLFLEKYCPGHFRPLLTWLGRRGHESVFLSEYRRKDFALDGIRHIQVRVPRAAAKGSAAEDALTHMTRRAEAFGAAMRKLKDSGFSPDCICLDGAAGCALLAEDIFPGCPRLGAFDGFSRPHSLLEVAPGSSDDETTRALSMLRVRELFQLGALQSCQRIFTSNPWQKDSFPAPWRSHLEIVPEGVDTEFFTPGPSRVRVGAKGAPAEIVTFIARTLSPGGGFGTFYRALPRILEARPDCYAIIVGYPEKPADGQGDAFAALLAETPVDRRRAHFVNFCPPEEYRAILRASHAHVVLNAGLRAPSGLLEAMACGCLLVTTDSVPTRDLLRNKENALLFAPGTPDALADSVITALRDKTVLAPLRQTAREDVLRLHTVEQCANAQARLLEEALASRTVA